MIIEMIGLMDKLQIRIKYLWQLNVTRLDTDRPPSFISRLASEVCIREEEEDDVHDRRIELRIRPEITSYNVVTEDCLPYYREFVLRGKTHVVYSEV